jgi:protein-tyrosine phosphatase
MTFKIKDGLWVGDIQDARNLERDFDRVFTLSKEETENTTDYYPLVDGENDHNDYENAVYGVFDAYALGYRCFVHCDAGVSRSPSVIAAAIALDEEKSYEKALIDVRSTYKIANPNRFLNEHGENVIENAG